MSFDPSQHKDPPVFGALKAGKYILAMASFERKESREGAAYLRGRFVAIGGPSKGSFFAGVSINTEKDVAMQRLAAYCRAIGRTEAFELDSDLEIAKALIGKPFLADVTYSKTKSGDREYENNDIKQYLTGPWTDDMRHQAQEWVSANRDKNADLSKYSGDSNEAGGGFGGGGYGGGGGGSSSSGMDFGDDEIPF